MPKPSIWVFLLLPLISALISLAIPYYNQKYLLITLIVYVLYVLMLFIGKVVADRTQKFSSLKFMGYLNFTMFSFFFILPLVKEFDGVLWIQVLLITIWLTLHVIFVVKCEVLFKIVIPNFDEPRSKWTLVYYGIFLLLFVLSGGGNFLITRNMSEMIGEAITLSYLTILLYIVGCWLGTLAGAMSIGVQGKLEHRKQTRKSSRVTIAKNQ